MPTHARPLSPTGSSVVVDAKAADAVEGFVDDMINIDFLPDPPDVSAANPIDLRAHYIASVAKYMTLHEQVTNILDKLQTFILSLKDATGAGVHSHFGSSNFGSSLASGLGLAVHLQPGSNLRRVAPPSLAPPFIPPTLPPRAVAVVLAKTWYYGRKGGPKGRGKGGKGGKGKGKGKAAKCYSKDGAGSGKGDSTLTEGLEKLTEPPPSGRRKFIHFCQNHRKHGE